MQDHGMRYPSWAGLWVARLEPPDQFNANFGMIMGAVFYAADGAFVERAPISHRKSKF